MEKLIEEIIAERRIPRAAYRLQFHSKFTFADAREIVDYLQELGIDTLYASPLFKARAGSTHGYDVCDFNEINPELGGESGFDELASALRPHGMGLLLDMVPNHMGINDPGNRWWLDVLEKGRCSRFADYFDIDWDPPNPALKNRILLPFLGDACETVLQRGELKVVAKDGNFSIAYHENRFPLSPRSCAPILRQIGERLPRDAGNVRASLERIEAVLAAWPRVDDEQACPDAGREAELVEACAQLAQLDGQSPAFRAALDAVLPGLNGAAGDRKSFERLDAVLQSQNYRLAFWRDGSSEINYRRFFEITDLACLRAEIPDVFTGSHQLLFRLLRENKVTALRIDHPDGLWNPEEYFLRLQQEFLSDRLRARLRNGTNEKAPRAAAAQWLREQARDSGGGIPGWPLYVVAEKILGERELLPRHWGVFGTTGYDYLNTLNGLFVDAAAEGAFENLRRNFAGWPHGFLETVHRSKRKMMDRSLISEVRSLAFRLKQLCAGWPGEADWPFEDLHAALAELIAAFPVYRTYLNEHSSQPSLAEREVIETAVAKAADRRPDLPRDIFGFLRSLLMLENILEYDAGAHLAFRRWIMKFQQITGPVMAKGLEDTAFYNDFRLISLNEVGGNPDAFGISIEEFHRRNAARSECWPHSMLATGTHDTKLSEDVRARINVLSEMPEEWRAAVEQWSAMNGKAKEEIDQTRAPDANDEYLLYQTLAGSWPMRLSDEQSLARFRERISAHMLKAARESKRHTSWLDQDQTYEAALQRFVERLLAAGDNPFLESMEQFQRKTAFFGVVNSLAQTLIKMTAPGVPDFYQGTELWDLSLVDPDNRRPVDYELRKRSLRELKVAFGGRTDGGPESLARLRSLLESPADGRIKLWLIWRTLQFRARNPKLFESGSYIPLKAAGSAGEHSCAFSRALDDDVVIAVPRLPLKLCGGTQKLPLGEIWGDTCLRLPSARSGAKWTNVLTGEVVAADGVSGRATLPLRDIFRVLPVALLHGRTCR